MIREIRKLIKTEPENIETYITFYNKHRTFNLIYLNDEFSFGIEIHDNDEGRPSIMHLTYNGEEIEVNTIQYVLLRGPVVRLCYKHDNIRKREYHYEKVVKPKKELLEYINKSVYSIRYKPSKQFNDCINAICFHIARQTGLLLEERKDGTKSGGIHYRVEFSSADEKIVIDYIVRVHGYGNEVSLEFDDKSIRLTKSEQNKIIEAMDTYFEEKEKQKRREIDKEKEQKKVNFKTKLEDYLKRK